MILLAGAAALAVTVSIASVILRGGSSRWLVDYPNRRSLHHRPVLRAGGIAMLIGMAGGLTVVWWTEPLVPRFGWVLAGALLIVGVSLAEDLRRVSPAIRLVFHFAAAACVVRACLAVERIVLPPVTLDLGAVASVVFTLLFVTWLINLYNFMDGMDGFAGGMTAIGFATLAALCAGSDATALAAVSTAVAAAALGFLLFNFPPARIFMGDVGSSLCGYSCAVAVLWAERAAGVPLWVSGLVFSPFIVDASVTLVRRVIAGNRPWQAHCNHFYQRLVRLGWGHRKTVVREYGLMLACAGSAAVAWQASAGVQAVVLVVWAVVYVVLMLGVARLERGPRT